MERTFEQNRHAVIALHKTGKSKSDIFKTLKSLGINRMFVWRTIDRFTATQSIKDRPRSGRKRSVRTKNTIKAVENRIRRNPLRKQKIMREMGISPRSMSRIIKHDLKMSAYRRMTGQRLTVSLKKIRAERATTLLSRYANSAHRKILFSDEKIFNIEQKYNRQNDKVYARSSREAQEKVGRVERGHHPSSVMVWWGVSFDGTTKLHFCNQGVKTRAKNYQEDILEKVVKPLSDTLFAGKHWVFQQDSAPAHKARTTQQWLEENVPEFIKASDWPSGSPDLNPLDYRLWSHLELMACHRGHRNLESLKAALVKAVERFPQEVLRTAIDDWPRRLQACVKAKGGHFE